MNNLTKSIENAQLIFCEYWFNQDPNAVNYLTNINVNGEIKDTPLLFYAIHENNLPLLKLLIKHECNIFIKDNQNRNVFHFLFQSYGCSQKFNEKIMDKLLFLPNILSLFDEKDFENNYPLQYAIQSGIFSSFSIFICQQIILNTSLHEIQNNLTNSLLIFFHDNINKGQLVEQTEMVLLNMMGKLFYFKCKINFSDIMNLSKTYNLNKLMEFLTKNIILK